MKVTIVVFDRKALELSESLVGGIEQFIDDHTARELHAKERDGNRSGMAGCLTRWLRPATWLG